MTFMSLLNIILIVFSPYLAIVPALFIALKMIHKDNCVFVKNSWNMGLIFLFIWSFLVGIINEDEFSTIASFAILIYFFLNIYLQNTYYTVEKIEKLFKTIIAVSIPSAIIGIIERVTPIHYSPLWWKHLFGIYPFVSFNEKYRISGTFGNPNIAGLWYAVMVLACFYFYQNSSKFKKTFYGLSVILFISTLMMTESRGAAIGLLIGLIIYAYFTGHNKKMSLLILLSLMVLTFGIAFPELFPRGNNLTASITDRKTIWINCWNMFKFKPITGWGLMGIYFADSDVYNYIKTFHAHNIIINMGTTLGIVGLGVFLWMIYYLFLGTILLHKQDCALTPLLAGVQGIILGQGLLDFAIMSPQACLIFITCSALINSLVFQYSNVSLSQFSIVSSIKDTLITAIEKEKL